MAESAMTGSITGRKGTDLLLRFRNVGVLAVLLLLVVGSAILTPHHTFVGIANVTILLALGAEFGVMSLGVGVLMIAGEFDLSVGSILALCAFVFALVLEASANPFVATAVTLVCGVLLGTINGLIVVKGNIVSFVATLGTMLTYRGLTEILSRGTIRTVSVDSYPVFLQMFSGKVAGVIPVQAIWFVLIAIILYFVVNRGRFGNWIFATGDNVQAARSMGIKTGSVKIVCFALVGALSAFAAVLQTTRLTAFSVHMGEGWELRAVAAAVVGGTALTGGRGSMVGIFLGTLVIIVVDNMISQLRLAYEYTYMVFGLVTLGSVLLDLWIERRLQRAATSSDN